MPKKKLEKLKKVEVEEPVEEEKIEVPVEVLAEPELPKVLVEKPLWPIKVMGGKKYYVVTVAHESGDVTTELKEVK